MVVATRTANPLQLPFNKGRETTTRKVGCYYPLDKGGQGGFEQQQQQETVKATLPDKEEQGGFVAGITTQTKSIPVLNVPGKTAYTINLLQDNTLFRIRDNNVDIITIDANKLIRTNHGSVLDIRGDLKLDGITLLATAAQLNELTEGFDAESSQPEQGDATDLHHHDGRYYTETELSNTEQGKEGSRKIGTRKENFTNISAERDDIEAILRALDTAIGTTSAAAAPVGATYLTLSSDATLTNERVATAGTGITITDAGANSTATIGVTADALDFAQLADSMTLDANLAISASGSNYSINFDSDTLAIDTANNRVGIGTASPGGKLAVTGTADDEQLIVKANGTQTANIFEIQDVNGVVLAKFTPAGSFVLPSSYITVGGTAAENPISIVGPSVAPACGSAGIHFGMVTASRGWIQTCGGLPLVINELGNNVGIGNDTSPDASLEVVNDGSGDSFIVADSADGDTSPFVITSAGDVGIGTSSPNNKLEVLSTTSPQVRIAYDTSNYMTTAVSSTGVVTFDTNGSGASFIFSDAISSPGAGSLSEHFGSGSTAAGASAMALGNAASAGGANGLAIGTNASASNTNAIAIGSASVASGDSFSTAIGVLSVASGAGGIALGYNASASGINALSLGNNTSNAFVGSIALGGLATTTATNQLVVGASLLPISDIYFGKGVVNATPTAYAINGTGGSGTDIAGAALQLAGGKGTGNASGGAIIFQTADAGSSGSTLQSLTQKFIIAANGTIGIGTDTSPDASLEIINDGSGDSFLVADTNDGDTTPFVITSAGKVGIGTGSPISSLSNTSSNSTDSLGVGTALGGNGLLWSTNTAGYVLVASNEDSTATYRNGLLVKTAATDTGSYITRMESGGTYRFTIRADGNVGIGASSAIGKLQIGLSTTQASALTYDASNGINEGALINTYIVSGDVWRRYTDIAALGFEDGTNGGSILRFLTNPETSLTTVERIRIDRTGNVGIGDTSPSALLSVGSGDLFTVTSTGQAATTDGIVTEVVAGACDDSAFTTDTNGLICIDSTNGRIYYRYGGAWHYSAQTAGFQIPNLITDGKNETEGLQVGDFVIGKLNQRLDDGALHGLYVKFDLATEIANVLAANPDSVRVLGMRTSNPNAAGSFTIPEGKTSARITFTAAFEDKPIISLTAIGHRKPYILEEVTKTGFTVKLESTTGAATFNWIVVEQGSTEGPQVEYSGSIEAPEEINSPSLSEGEGEPASSAGEGGVITPTPSPTPTSTPEITPELSPEVTP